MTTNTISSVVLADSDKLINGIEISGVIDVSIGNSSDLSTIFVPTDAKYTITKKYWNNNINNIFSFEDLRKYTLCLEIKANEGYTFDNSPFIKVNGQEKTDISLSRFENTLYVNIGYSFLKPIDKIELPEFPNSVPIGAINIPIPVDQHKPLIETDKYTVKSYWFNYVEGVNSAYRGEVDGVFEEGRIYVYTFTVDANEGYEITDSTVFTVGGKQISRNSIYNDYNDFHAHINKLYNHSSRKAISTVDLTVEAPVVGNPVNIKAETNSKGVLLKDFIIEGSANPIKRIPSELGNMKLTHVELNGSYSADKYYTAKGIIQAEKGYYFTEDLKIKINGKDADIFHYYMFNMLNQSCPTQYNPFIFYFGKAIEEPRSNENSSTFEPKSESKTESKTVVRTEDNIENASEIVSDNSVSQETLIDNTTSNVDATPEVESKNSSVLIIILVSVCILILCGVATYVFFYFKRKNITKIN